MATTAEYALATAAATAELTKFIEQKVPSFEQGMAESFLSQCMPAAVKAAIDAVDAARANVAKGQA